MRATTRFLTAMALYLGLAGGAAASVELVGNAPFQDSAYGQQSDGNTSAYTQTFVAPSNSILESIRWWGFHSQDSGGSNFDNFLVYLNDVEQSGSLTVVNSGIYDQYTLDIADITLTASSLSIVNDSGDVEWFWQSTPAQGNGSTPDQSAVAFSLIGRINTQTPGTPIPEPSGLPLLLLGIAALALQKIRHARIPTYRQ